MACTAHITASKIGKQLSKTGWLLKPTLLVLLLLILAGAVLGILFVKNQLHSSLSFEFNLWRQILFFGLLLPLSCGLMLYTLFYTRQKQTKRADGLHQPQDAEHPGIPTVDMDELAKNIVQFPQCILPVTSATLYLYHREKKRFELAAEWFASGKKRQSRRASQSPELCSSCELAQTAPPNFITCQHLIDSSIEKQSNPYCLPILNHHRPVGLLHIDFPTEKSITNEQINQLENSAPEMARAIENAQQALAAPKPAENSQPQQASLLSNRQYDLGSILLDYARAAGRRMNFKTQLLQEGESYSLPLNTRRQLVFICQEAINNIEQHAHAGVVQIQLTWRPSELILKITDDGRGFDPSVLPRDRQPGLSIMHERAKEINSQISVISSRHTGTNVTLFVPIPLENRLPDLRTLYDIDQVFPFNDQT